MQNQTFAKILVLVLWGLVLLLVPFAWASSTLFLRGFRLGWLMMMPFIGLSTFVFLSAFLEFWREHRHEEVSMSSERLQWSEHLYRISLTCLHLLPLSGLLGAALLLGSRHVEAGLSLPLQIGLLSLFSTGALWLLRPTQHGAWRGGMLLLSLVWMLLAWQRFNPQDMWRLSVRSGPLLVLYGSIFVAYLGLSLRWWKRDRLFRPWLQWAALVFVGLVVAGTVAAYQMAAKQWMLAVGTLLLFLSGVELLHQIPQAFQALWKVWRLEEEEPRFDFGLVMLGSFPLAYLSAMAGWLVVGGAWSGSPLHKNPNALLVLLVAHGMAATGIALFLKMHSTELHQENRLWVMLKAVGLFAMVFVPFGFGALALFRSVL